MKEIDATQELIELLHKQKRDGVQFVSVSPENLAALTSSGSLRQSASAALSNGKKSSGLDKSNEIPIDARQVTPKLTEKNVVETSAVLDTETSPTETDFTSLSLQDLEKVALTCRRCRLGSRRKNLVFGDGNPNAGLMFIGEGPGRDEDEKGKPFVGKAGRLLDQMIAAMQFRRQDIYIANIVKCRAPGNRNPEEDEANFCLPYLERQIELINPEVIVLLGAVPLKYLLGETGGINLLHGRWFDYKGHAVLPTFHPAYLLRMENKKRDAWEDLKKVMRKLGKDPGVTRRRKSGS